MSIGNHKSASKQGVCSGSLKHARMLMQRYCRGVGGRVASTHTCNKFNFPFYWFAKNTYYCMYVIIDFFVMKVKSEGFSDTVIKRRNIEYLDHKHMMQQ